MEFKMPTHEELMKELEETHEKAVRASIRTYAIEGISRIYLDFAKEHNPGVVTKDINGNPMLIAPLDIHASTSFEDSIKIIDNLYNELDEAAKQLIGHSDIASTFGTMKECLTLLKEDKIKAKEALEEPIVEKE